MGQVFSIFDAIFGVPEVVEVDVEKLAKTAAQTGAQTAAASVGAGAVSTVVGLSSTGVNKSTRVKAQKEQKEQKEQKAPKGDDFYYGDIKGYNFGNYLNGTYYSPGMNLKDNEGELISVENVADCLKKIKDRYSGTLIDVKNVSSVTVRTEEHADEKYIDTCYFTTKPLSELTKEENKPGHATSTNQNHKFTVIYNPEAILYENDNFGGKSHKIKYRTDEFKGDHNLVDANFNDRVSSLKVGPYTRLTLHRNVGGGNRPGGCYQKFENNTAQWKSFNKDSIKTLNDVGNDQASYAILSSTTKDVEARSKYNEYGPVCKAPKRAGGRGGRRRGR